MHKAILGVPGRASELLPGGLVADVSEPPPLTFLRSSRRGVQDADEKHQRMIEAHAARLNAMEAEVLGHIEQRGRKIAAEDADFLRKLVAANRASAAPTFAAAGAGASGGGAAAASAAAGEGGGGRAAAAPSPATASSRSSSATPAPARGASSTTGAAAAGGGTGKSLF